MEREEDQQTWCWNRAQVWHTRGDTNPFPSPSLAIYACWFYDAKNSLYSLDVVSRPITEILICLDLLIIRIPRIVLECYLQVDPTNCGAKLKLKGCSKQGSRTLGFPWAPDAQNCALAAAGLTFSDFRRFPNSLKKQCPVDSQKPPEIEPKSVQEALQKKSEKTCRRSRYNFPLRPRAADDLLLWKKKNFFPSETWKPW